MQDRYAGDVGDFGKYGLLRCFSAFDPRLSLGIVWYRTDEEVLRRDPPNDGRHTRYVSAELAARFRPCDPDLFEAMDGLLASNVRSVAAVERCGVLPPDTAYVSAPLCAPGGRSASDRLQLRNDWLAHARAAVRGKDIVFVDPDNGLETSSVPITSPRAPKYTFFSDLDALLHPGQTLVAYHHLGHSPHVAEVRRRLAQLGVRLNRRTFALRFRRGTARAFLIAPAPDRDGLLRERARSMVEGPWGAHFDWIDATAP